MYGIPYMTKFVMVDHKKDGTIGWWGLLGLERHAACCPGLEVYRLDNTILAKLVKEVLHKLIQELAKQDKSQTFPKHCRKWEEHEPRPIPT